MNFFKFIIMKVKMCTTGKSFGEICLKAPRDAFFQYVICDEVKGKWTMKERGTTQYLAGGDIQ